MLLLVGCTDPAPEQLTYVITFKQTGQQDIVKEVLEGEDLTDIPSPAPKTGYTVVWDETDFSNVKEDMIVNAVETVKSYTINYDENGGREIDGTTQVTYGQTYTLKSTTRAGYIFAGWEYDGKLINSSLWEIDAESITVKIKWNYQIIFRQSGQEDVKIILHEGETFREENLPTTKLRTGYIVSWPKTDYSQVTSNTVIVANEEAKSYRIYYDGITSENIPSGVNINLDENSGKYYHLVTYGQAFSKNNLLNPITNEQDKVFDYWSGSDAINQSVWYTAEDVTVTVNWRGTDYQWIFKLSETDITVVQMEEGKSLERYHPQVPQLPDKKGYSYEWSIDFWNYTSGGGTVVPIETAKTYTVNFSLKEGESAEFESKQFTYGQPYSLSNDAVHVNGFHFVGWEYNGEIFPERADKWNRNFLEPITVTAVWQAIVTFRQSGEEDVEKYCDIGAKLTDIPTVVQNDSDRRFEWDFDFETVITQNLTVTTKDKVYKVNLKIDGGKVDGVTVLTSIVIEVKFGYWYKLPSVTFNNFEFDGWTYNEEDFASSGYWSIDKDDVVIVAKRGEYHTDNY